MKDKYMNDIVPFEFPTDSPKLIKVVGVGGGGGNAVTHMFKEGIDDVSFAICNTDNQALKKSPVPVKIRLGVTGLGAGNRPERAREAAEASVDDIKTMLDDGATRMVFITAGMGGGTGTGAGPVIAGISKEMGILTIGIVTIPFLFEGEKKITQALDGVDEMSKHVDALLVINNERLRSIYSDLSCTNAFKKADDTLSVAARSIAEIITTDGIINLDFEDVKTCLKDGGVAIMSTGYSEGDNRVQKAIQDALHSPLLNNNDIFKSKKIILNVSFCSDCELMMDEMNEIHDFMNKFSKSVEVIWGMAEDSSLGKKVKITLLATGFGMDNLSDIEKMIPLEDEDKSPDIDTRIETVYGTDSSINNGKRKFYIYGFKPSDLDDDNVISMVEMSPTYQRKNDTLKKIEKEKMVEVAKPVEEAAAETPGVITF